MGAWIDDPLALAALATFVVSLCLLCRFTWREMSMRAPRAGTARDTRSQLAVRLPSRAGPRHPVSPSLATTLPSVARHQTAHETICPACLCVSLENHEGTALDGRPCGAHAPLSSVVTAAMLHGSTLSLLCAHHTRALALLEVPGNLRATTARQCLAVRGMDHYAARLVRRVRAQRA